MEEPLTRPRAHALLHFTILLWGTTAILGKSIQIAALPLVFYRVTIVTLLMAAVLVRRRVPFAVPWKRAAELGAAGVLVALHWVLFYAAVKLAGVSIAVLCLSTVTFFTALIEPLVFRRPLKKHELVLGALVVVGVVFLLRLEVHGSPRGYAMGLCSAFFCSSANSALSFSNIAFDLLSLKIFERPAWTSPMGRLSVSTFRGVPEQGTILGGARGGFEEG